MGRPAISVIIPTWNSRSEKNFSIFYVLQSLLVQEFRDFEIVIVDDHSSDTTLSGLMAGYPSIRVIESDRPKGSVGALRNLGASAAHAPLLVFLDDDTVLLDRDALAKLGEIMRHNDYCCGADRYWTSVYWYKFLTPVQSASSIVSTISNLSMLPRGINRQVGFRDLNEFTFIGNFGAIHTEEFLKIGGFDEQFTGWGFEDVDLMMRLCMAELRYTLLCNHGLSVAHLTHPAENSGEYLRNVKRFNNLELERGYYFHPNHFFGVYEADGYSILTKI